MSVAWLKEILEIDGTAVDMLEIVHESEWEDQGKYQTKQTVVKLSDDEDFHPDNWPVESKLEPGYYQINDARSGSYWSDYEYDEPSVFKVEPYEQTITVTKWRKV